MGHTPKTHAEWYRLPSDIYQTAKIAKILLLSQGDNVVDIKGKKLSEIEIDDELIENNQSESSDSGESEDGCPKRSSKLKNVKNEKCKKIRKLIPWSTKEKNITQDFF